MCVCMHVSMWVNVKTREINIQCLPLLLSICFLRQGLSLKLNPNNFGGLASQQAPGILQPLLPRSRSHVTALTPLTALTPGF